MQSLLVNDPKLDELLQWENEKDIMKWLDNLQPGGGGKIDMPECKKWINIMLSLTSLTFLESHVSY
jgi:hypothetical protein